jgi:uncharacterized membrane protein YedE/YeeE
VKRAAAGLLSGLIFGAGLALSGMTNPAKVLGFLDVTGAWDPSLLLVMGGAVVVAYLGFRVVLERPRPVFDKAFHLPTRRAIDPALVAGAGLFGIGWGVSGYCPGPAVALLAAPGREALIFLPALVLGILLHRWLRRATRTGPDARASEAD